MASSDQEPLREVLLDRLEAGDELVFDDLLSITARRPGRVRGVALDTQAIADEVAERTGTEPGKARMQLAFVMRELREALLSGEPHSLAGVLLVRMVAGETRVTVDSATARRTIAAGVPLLGIDTQGDAIMRLANTRVGIKCERGFADELAKRLRPQIHVVVPEQDLFADTIQYHFERRGWDVRVHSDAAVTEAAVRGAPVSLVLCDLQLTGAQQLARAVKSCPSAGPVSLLTLAPAGGMSWPPTEGFRVLGDAELEQPFELGELLERASAELARGDRRGTDVRTAARMELVTAQLALEQTCSFVFTLFARAGIDEESLIGLSTAFREALANAARHGNAGDPTKLIHMKYLLTADAVSVSITDEGAGFDAGAALQAARDPDALENAREKVGAGSIGGLGITMMARCVDDVTFSPRGNSITLVKRI